MQKKLFFVLTVMGIFFSCVTLGVVSASEITASGLAYLSSRQEESGKISGFGGESQWAAIAFSAHGVNASDVKNPSTSLRDYLLTDVPADGASATEWERRVLAIVAIGDDPSSFNGVNYVETLQALENNDQLGDVTLLNDDIFGLLALIASGELADDSLKQDVLNFIISHQGSDGGFSWSADSSCAWCGSDGNDTAAALQALQAAKEDNLTHPDLDVTIDEALQYLLTTQKDDGGFGYDAFSDADGSSTAWALMALNVLGQGDSAAAQEAVSWLESHQESDGGFHWMSGYGSDTYTTSHALIALSGEGWIVQIFSPSSEPTPPATSSPSPSPSSTPASTPSPTPSASPVVSHSPSPTPSPTSQSNQQIAAVRTSPRPAVLGAASDEEPGADDEASPTPSVQPSPSPTPSEEGAKKKRDYKDVVKIMLLVIAGASGAGIVILKFWQKKK